MPPDDPRPLHRAAREIASYDWIVLTSANGARFLAEALALEEKNLGALGGGRICAIGPGTAAMVRQLGGEPSLVPTEHKAEGLISALQAQGLDRCRVLFPRAVVARELLPERLRQAGAAVDLVPAYQTVIPPEPVWAAGMAALRARAVDIVTFTSASTVSNLYALVGPGLVELLRGVVIAVIGPITEQACKGLGLTVDVSPEQYTVPALIDALLAHFAAEEN
jgi:uroporphyrinogen III methyltransferase/synthase